MNEEKLQSELEELRKQLADTRLERDGYFDELHAKRQELASVKSELEEKTAIVKQLHIDLMSSDLLLHTANSDNKRLRDVMEGIKNLPMITLNDGSYVVVYVASDVQQLIASLERGE